MDRWAPVYDSDDLAARIGELVRSEQIQHQFYTAEPAHRICQGDIVRLASPVPLIHRDGRPAIVDSVLYWMVIGNTCDIDRDVSKAPWSQLVPLFEVSADEPTAQEIAALRRYSQSRRFYVPPWSSNVEGCHYVADFLRPVAIDKHALLNVARVEAKLTYAAWVLLHSCLVRFLARDDGRFDE